MEPRLAIIRIIGCPEVEPEISLHLRVCSECREYLVKQQVERAVHDEEPVEVDMLTELALLHEKLSAAESSVNSQLRKYQEIVHSLEDNSRTSGSNAQGNSSQSNMRILAKAQGDLTDFLAQHVLFIQRLKRLVPKTDAQSRLLKNYIKAKCDFYLENMSSFRKIESKLGESSPPEMLEFIQRVMDKNAIVSAHLYLRQLVYEAINLCDKYELKENAPQLLVSLEQMVEKDVAACLQMEREDMGQHLELMKEMIRMQIKEHQLIRLSRNALRMLGKAHVQEILKTRMDEVLYQISLQLKLKSAHRSFSQTKKALEQFSVPTAAS
ncbi:hypothetical protein C0Q70_21532 [Pomacea canaliculata]|uniref:Uncharacterized protein n=1 Tax=Pomacea canaliculata TaxID=400727 RepID=A0A2T7NCS5_POMCA|nr:hypothetical protein C0Q70_21532 [Pomacea canaliculata]